MSQAIQSLRFSAPAKGATVLALAVAILAALLACGGTATSQPATPAPTPAAAAATPDSTAGRAAVPMAAVPMVDTSEHSVPLSDILFDTFGRISARYVPLDQADDDLILSLRDAIAPVARPAYGGVDSLPWLGDDDLVMGYNSGDEAYAYPINILNFHEIVNDTIGGLPVLVTYCPLCLSGVVFSREVDGEVLTFGNTSALYQSDLVMYDHQTGSYWFQVGGEAVVGTSTGARLNPLPSATMTWGEWKVLHPQTRLITGPEGRENQFADDRYARSFSPDYADRISDGRFVFPVDEDKLDARLPSGEMVLTVEVGEAVTAFPLGLIGDGAVNSEVGGQPVVIFTANQGRSVAAFSREVADSGEGAGMVLTFDIRETGEFGKAGSFTDEETGSVWNAAGTAVEGPLAGSKLERVSTRRSLWFAVAISFPGVELFDPR